MPEPEEKPLNVTKMAILFVNTTIFMKIPLIYMGMRIAQDPAWYNILGFCLVAAVSITSLIYFIIKD